MPTNPDPLPPPVLELVDGDRVLSTGTPDEFRRDNDPGNTLLHEAVGRLERGETQAETLDDGQTLVTLRRKRAAREAEAVVDGWFSFDPDNGFERHLTEPRARGAALLALDHYRDDCRDSDGWAEEVDRVCYGQILGVVVETGRGIEVEGDPVAEEWVDYGLRPVASTPTPADPALMGLDLFADRDELLRTLDGAADAFPDPDSALIEIAAVEGVARIGHLGMFCNIGRGGSVRVPWRTFRRLVFALPDPTVQLTSDGRFVRLRSGRVEVSIALEVPRG